MFAEWKRCGAEGIMNELEYPRIYCYTSRHVCLHITLRVMTKIGNGFQSAVCLQSVQGDIYQVSNIVPRVNTPSHITFPPDLMRICPNQISVIFNWTCVLTSGTTKHFIVYIIVKNLGGDIIIVILIGFIRILLTGGHQRRVQFSSAMFGS